MTDKEKIITTSAQLFSRFGIKSVTMDDIAKELGISKKTIYQYFKDKKEIVRLVVKYKMEEDTKHFQNIKASSENVVEALCKIAIFFRQMINKINPTMFLDLQKYHKDAFQIFQECKDKVHMRKMVEMIETGQKEGYFRSEVNAEIITTMRFEQAQLGFKDHVFPREKFDFAQVQMQLFDHFVHGIITPKGKELFENYLNQHSA
ncbi:TetR/AcrR family transcriptional regulator [Xanthovirga aplysinae]|uniref:TetR/AcrR family transcriptional regulator n=1 Tax=Xanthovirga aplysinae TaxID=2529853 RepID=UPI0012BD448C|nr:TetR/AcrR family transcriptional regulator [Xanthovirga aplysinae]MTI30363.1 TetR/AcrR family transcriptional regulator [Xanthovirga aplysinae]